MGIGFMMGIFNRKKTNYADVQNQFDALKDYLITEDSRSLSLGKFSEMVKTYKKMPRKERKQRKEDFLELIERIDDIVKEEYGNAHILCKATHYYLSDKKF